MKTIWNWLVTSSADPEKTSLMLKGLLLAGGAYLVQAAAVACTLGIAYVCLINAPGVDQTVAYVVQFATGILYAFGALIGLIGFCRKIYYGRWSAPQQQ